jgi:ribosomal protein L18E
MFITDNEAAAMYARAFRRWHGPKAKSMAKSKIRSLRAKDDHKGVSMWRKVLTAIEREEKALRDRRQINLKGLNRSSGPVGRPILPSAALRL